MAVLVNIVLVNIPGPVDKVHAHIQTSLTPGPDLEWGTGDERIILRHTGGEPLLEHETTIRLIVDGLETTITGTDLDWPDGRLEIGDSWNHTTSIELNAVVETRITYRAASTSLVSDQRIIAERTSCATDTKGPTATFEQTPADLSVTNGNQSVTIKATLLDQCSGVNETAVPQLHYTLSTGSPINMTSTGIRTWQATVPAPPTGWNGSGGQTFSYYLTNMKDKAGNTANTSTEDDYIQSTAPATTYVNNYTITFGSVANWNNSRAAGDAAHATLTTGQSGSSGTTTLNADSIVRNHPKWNDEEKAYAPGGGEAKYERNIAQPIRYGTQDGSGGSGAISSVTLYIHQKIPNHINDGWQLGVCIYGTCSKPSNFIEGTSTLTTLSYDVTALRPGGGNWKWSDLKDIEIQITPRVIYDSTNEHDQDDNLRVDHAYIKIGYQPTQDLKIDADFPTIPNSGIWDLELRYRASGETFRVLVWNGSSWNPRPQLLGSTIFTDWTTELTTAEYNGGAPQIRFESLQTKPLAGGELHIDYIRVQS